ncbi:MAG: TraB/GumN family protein [Clostridia bacterium]
MNRGKGKRVLCAALCIVLCLCTTGCSVANGSQGICYRVTGGKNEMFLLGSIHVGSKEMYPMGETILSALEDADTLVLECDTESEEALAASLEAMRYPQGETLKEQLSAESYQLLEQAMRIAGYPAGTFDAYKPWAVVSTLSVYTTGKEMGVGNAQQAIDFGVEKKLLSLAKKAGKHMDYLETVTEQFDVMDGFSPELQEYMLQTACKAIAGDSAPAANGTGMRDWPEWWRTGNSDAFSQAYLTGLEQDPRADLMQEYHQKLLVKRNQSMAQELQKRLENDEAHRYFVSIGLLHLVLPNDSVIHELEKMGYAVEAVKSN